MSDRQSQEADRIVPSETVKERELPTNLTQVPIASNVASRPPASRWSSSMSSDWSTDQNAANLYQAHHHQQIGQQIIQQDNRQNFTIIIDQSERSDVSFKEEAAKLNDTDRQMVHQTISNLPEFTSLATSHPKKGSDDGVKKIKETTLKLYDPKYDVDLCKFDISSYSLPEVCAELFLVEFYEGRLIPNDNKYDPKIDGFKLNKFDSKVDFDKLVFYTLKSHFISIIGYPGVGKTTLSKRLARRLCWCADLLVFRKLFLNMNDCDEETFTLKQFLLGDSNYNLNENEENSAFEWIKTNPENVCIILDGFDQVNWRVKENVKKCNYNSSLTSQELVSNLCQGNFLRNCHLIFASRPHAMLSIPKKCRPNLTFFLRDLTSSDMRKLFDALINNQSKADELWGALTTKAPQLESLCHNPLMLQLYVRASLGTSGQMKGISTMTRVFHSVLENLKASDHAVSLSDEIVMKLSEIAYKATKEGTVLINTQTLKRQNLAIEDVQDLVVTLLGSNKKCALFEGNQQLYFTHQTFQEYFSALYLCQKMPSRKFASFVRKHLLDDHWSIVVQFISGILLGLSARNDEEKQKKDFLLEELKQKTEGIAKSNNSRSIVAISKMLRESNDEKVIMTAGSHFEGGRIAMRSSDTQNDFDAVTSFLKYVSARVEFLGLSGCYMTSNQFRPWIEAIKSMPGSIVGMSLDGNLLSSVDDIIQVLDKVEKKVWMWNCFDADNGKMRSLNMKERARLQEALVGLENKNLVIAIGRDDDFNSIYVTHNGQDH